MKKDKYEITVQNRSNLDEANQKPLRRRAFTSCCLPDQVCFFLCNLVSHTTAPFPKCPMSLMSLCYGKSSTAFMKGHYR